MKKRARTTGHGKKILVEHGTILREAGTHIALGYPGPYRVGASSLGAQTVYRRLNEVPGLACERFFTAGRDPSPRPLRTVESGRPAEEAEAVAFSVACETELLEVVKLFEALNLRPLAGERGECDPPVIIGGPLTYVSPELVAPFADVVAMGEADHILDPLGRALVEHGGRADFIDRLRDFNSGIWLPQIKTTIPKAVEAPLECLPAYAATWSPQAEFKDLFLVEATRGCRHHCAFCVMSASARGASRFRAADAEKILAAIPPQVPGVGLVGAAVTDHPEIEQIVAAVVRQEKRVSLSSIRADKLTDRLLTELTHGGLRTLTIAADGASERLRKAMHKGIRREHLLRAAKMAAAAGLRGVKIYSMFGLPGEQDDDLNEFAELLLEMGQSIRVTAALQAFVPKPGTPLEDFEMPKTSELERKLEFIRR